jgi:hypothetical protein
VNPSDRPPDQGFGEFASEIGKVRNSCAQGSIKGKSVDLRNPGFVLSRQSGKIDLGSAQKKAGPKARQMKDNASRGERRLAEEWEEETSRLDINALVRSGRIQTVFQIIGGGRNLIRRQQTSPVLCS